MRPVWASGANSARGALSSAMSGIRSERYRAVGRFRLIRSPAWCRSHMMDGPLGGSPASDLLRVQPLNGGGGNGRTLSGRPGGLGGFRLIIFRNEVAFQCPRRRQMAEKIGSRSDEFLSQRAGRFRFGSRLHQAEGLNVSSNLIFHVGAAKVGSHLLFEVMHRLLMGGFQLGGQGRLTRGDV